MAEGGIPTDAVELTQPKPQLLQEGQRVKIGGSRSEKPEWVVKAYDPISGKYTVSKTEKSGILRRDKEVEATVSEANLRETNEALFNLLGAGSFDQLYSSIAALGSFEGSLGTYSPSSLVSIIKRVRTGEIDVEHVTKANGLRSKVIELMENELKLVIQKTKEDFQASSGTRGIDQVGTFANAHNGSIYAWQAVRYGDEIQHKDSSLYRGYLMIEPTDFTRALELVSEIAERRKTEGKSTAFKWVVSVLAKGTGVDDGNYRHLLPIDPRIVVYGTNPEDIREILTELSQDPVWVSMEERRRKRYVGNPPRRPGTNAFIDDKGQEWRSLNYNDQPGYSEDQADNLDWRDLKTGGRTGY